MFKHQLSKCRTTEEWLVTQQHHAWKESFDINGFLVIKDILSAEELKVYEEIYEYLLSVNSGSSTHRHDLGSHIERQVADKENICQIMWPSRFVTELTEGPFHKRALTCAKLILGADMEFDFDMMISKAPLTGTATPPHQDESYWPDLPDKRAVSIWLSIDDATIDNGCMQFVPGSHKLPVRPHKPAQKGHHVLCCDAQEEEFFAIPLSPGSCTLHHGRTIHYTRGNTTCLTRRALIMNSRPGPMVRLEREKGFDHGKEEGVKNVLGEGQTHKTL